jgi:hypothetical protein
MLIHIENRNYLRIFEKRITHLVLVPHISKIDSFSIFKIAILFE